MGEHIGYLSTDESVNGAAGATRGGGIDRAVPFLFKTGCSNESRMRKQPGRIG